MMQVLAGLFGRLVRNASLLLASLLAILPTQAANGQDDFRILYAESFTPIPAAPQAGTAQKATDDPLLAGLRFDAFGRRFDLALERNARIMRDAKSAGVAYRGSIAPLPGSWVRLTRTGNDLHGLIWDGSELYVIEPAREARAFLVDPAEYAKGTNVIYRLSNTLVDLGPGFCSAVAPSTQDDAGTGLSTFKALTRDLKSHLVLQQAAGATLTLSLSALGDASFLQRYPSATEAHDAVLVRLNNVDGIYSAQLGVELSISAVEVYDNGADPFSPTLVPLDLLQELANYRSASATLKNDGLTHLFTGRDLGGPTVTTVGIAYIDTLCRREYGVSLTESRGRGSVLESLIAAHEIGHNFGAHHDGDVNFECAATPDRQYIMASESAIGNDTFSSCSVAKISQSVAAAACINPLPPPDVDVQFAAAPSDLSLGQTFDWTVTVTNRGGQYAAGPSLEVGLPAGIAFVSASVTGGTCTSGAGTVQCSLGSLAAGQDSQVTLSLTAGASGLFTVTAMASVPNDGNLANNSATAMLPVDATVPVTPQTASATSSRGGGGGSMGLLMLSLMGLLAHARRRCVRPC